ncbi:ribosome assembly cofactor RimP [Algibacter amylolyticus]|uniref:Ribosome maturation factor RimP n=1 Tax=Algibacter amylolyticus TaxID=1608400 RepID=A0A5M7BLJ8_9FLAO|nr:ribosome assembly cofactor RimP [Algibacter amylolyticus]KAA5827755.1 ribosome assembly cofactor RimP [Algibacter amylolyticus]MBB5266979.1 ribosome maturation factor RimP [Algibacter amylolyticus]TSJ82000.1 ribosome assembly cofactor RimP [Algibacter amylolyticus]
MFKNTVTELLEAALLERPDLFLIDFSINSENHIKIIVDGDNGLLVEDCMFISRAIENNIDREENDFSLEVMSAGAASPLTHKRQYKKNLKRTLSVRTSSEEIEGTLTEATEDNIKLEWKVREPKPVGKGKVTVKKEINIPYENIVEAKVMIKF